MPSRPEMLIDHFLKAAGIAAVSVDGTGAIGAVDVVGINAPPGCVLMCCTPGKQNGIVRNAAGRMAAGKGSAGAPASLRAAAADGGIALTPHQTVIQRACAAVEMVEAKIAALQQTGGMKELNAEFKAARNEGSCARYQDFLHAKKMTMLMAIAQRR